MTQKKLIPFEDSIHGMIEEYAEKYRIKTFTEAVRRLLEIGLKHKDEYLELDVEAEIQALKEKVEQLSWWTSDDNTARLGNMELEVKKLEEMEKKVNVLTAAMKLFKGHTENREIHLQD